MQITDPVHGAIEVLDSEKPVIDHPAFQRLRKIGQLSNVHLAFPSALHNRFSHSLGVMHVASRLFDALAKNLTRREGDAFDYIRKAIRLAGLLHDLGHGPYSHQSESYLKEKVNYEDLKVFHIDKGYLKKDAMPKVSHELFSFYLIDRILKDVGNAVKPQDVCALLDENFQISSIFVGHLKAVTNTEANTESLVQVLRSLLSSHIDADRIDYLQRDTYFTGAKIGRVDFEHLLGSVELCKDDAGEFFIKLRPNCISTIEQILLARKAMFDQVYGQRTNVIFGKVLKQILEDALSAEFAIGIKSYEDYLQFTDEKLNQAISRWAYSKQDSVGRTLCRMFVMRMEPDPLSDLIFCKAKDKEDQKEELGRKIAEEHQIIEIPRMELIKGEKRQQVVIREIRVSNSPMGEPIELQLASHLIKSNFADEKDYALLAVRKYLGTEYQKRVNETFDRSWGSLTAA